MTSCHGSVTRRAAQLLVRLTVALCCVAAQATALAAPRESVAILVDNIDNPVALAVANAAAREAQAHLGLGVRIELRSAGLDPIRQAEQLRQALAIGHRLVLIMPVDASALAPWVEEAGKKGIVIVGVGRAVPHATLTVDGNDFEAGHMACDALAGKLRGRGEVAIIGSPQDTSSQERARGCRSALQPYGAIRLVSQALDGGASREGGLLQATRLLTEWPLLVGIFAANDESALGAEAAALRSGRKDLVITAVDGSPDLRERLRDSHSLITATVDQQPVRQGRMAMDLGLTLLRSAPRASVPEMALMPRLITRDTELDTLDW